MTRWIIYTLIRLGLFGSIFAVLMVLGLEWWLSAILATIMAFSLAYIFFYRQRRELAEDLQARIERSKKPDADSAIEDDAIDSEGDGGGKGSRKNK